VWEGSTEKKNRGFCNFNVNKSTLVIAFIYLPVDKTVHRLCFDKKKALLQCNIIIFMLVDLYVCLLTCTLLSHLWVLVSIAYVNLQNFLVIPSDV
jgi:hypothetical protein